jgi:hypothetical protein
VVICKEGVITSVTVMTSMTVITSITNEKRNERDKQTVNRLLNDTKEFEIAVKAFFKKRWGGCM